MLQKVLIIAVFTLAACKDSQQEKEQVEPQIQPAKDEYIVPANDTTQGEAMSWKDSLVVEYIQKSNNQAIRLSNKDSLNTQWMMDNLVQTDTANYYVYHLGHSFEGRFVTDGWLYIDSASRQIFEYDVAADSLIKWP